MLKIQVDDACLDGERSGGKVERRSANKVLFVAAGWSHNPTDMAIRKLKEISEFKWIDTILSNLKTSPYSYSHAFGFRKYAARYLESELLSL